MATKKVGNKWHVVRKDGTLGKRAYTSAANAAKAQARGRALSRSSSPTSKSSKSSTPSLPPAGGASTTAKIGLLIRRARTALNLTAPGWGAFRPGQAGIDGTLEGQMARGIRRYAGYNYLTNEMNLRHVIPTYQGIGVSLGNDWFDRKMGNSARISRGKLFPALSEALPALRARMEVPASAAHPLYEAARNYNKRTTGYDPSAEDFAFVRAEEYFIGKALVAAYNKCIPQDWKSAANSVLPKGFNPF